MTLAVRRKQLVMASEMCIAHTLGCMVHAGEFVRVKQLRPGASYIIHVTSTVFFDTMSKRDKKKIVDFGWNEEDLPGEWLRDSGPNPK